MLLIARGKSFQKNEIVHWQKDFFKRAHIVVGLSCHMKSSVALQVLTTKDIKARRHLFIDMFVHETHDIKFKQIFDLKYTIISINIINFKKFVAIKKYSK